VSAPRSAIRKSPATSKNIETDIDLSHRSRVKPCTRELARRIQSVYVDGRQPTLWLDEAEVQPRKSVVAEINRGLERSRSIGLLVTPDYFDSPSGWTDATVVAVTSQPFYSCKQFPSPRSLCLENCHA